MKRIVYADALRVLAILLVVIHHVAITTDFSLHGIPHRLTFAGTWGVDCFFVLTGYLLSGPFLRAIINDDPFPSFKLFWSRRGFRIYPLYLLCLVISIADLAIEGHAPSFADVFVHLAFLHSFFINYQPSINPPLWTMALDAQFYVILPIVAFVLKRLLSNHNRLFKIRFLWVTIGICISGSLLERIFVAINRLQGATIPLALISFESRNLISMASDFALGIALAFVLILGSTSSINPRSSFFMLTFIGLLAVVSVKFETIDMNRVHEAWAIVALRDFIGGCIATGLLWLLLKTKSKLVDKVVSSGVVRFLAPLAYAIYLFHFPILQHASRAFSSSLGSPITTLLIGAAVCAPVISLAALVHVLVERPFLNLRDRAREEKIVIMGAA